METEDHRPRVAAQRRERMRGRLLEAALALVSTQGLAALTIDAVVAHAGVARGSFYKYFDAPGALLQALADEVADSLIRTLHPMVEPLEDPAQRVALGVRTVLSLALKHPPLGAFMARSGWPALESSHALHQLVGADLARGIRKGRFARMHIEVAKSALAGTMVGALHAVSSGALPRDFPEQTAAAVLRALGLSADEALSVVSAKLDKPSLGPQTLVGQIMAGSAGAAPSPAPAPPAQIRKARS